jgi:hypothetical protein
MEKYIEELYEKIKDKAIVGFPFIRSFIANTELSNAYIPYNVFLVEFVKKHPEFVYVTKPRKMAFSVEFGENQIFPCIVALPKRSLINIEEIKKAPFLKKEKLIDVEILPIYKALPVNPLE